MTAKNPLFLHTDAFIAKLKSTEELISQGRLKDAARQLNTLSRTASRDPRIFLLASKLAEAAQNLPGILFASHRAYELAPQWPVTAMHLAVALDQQERFEESVAFAQTALDLATRQGALDLELIDKASTLAHTQRRYTLALQWLELGRANFPENAPILSRIAMTHMANDNPDAALPVLEQLMLAEPKNTLFRLAHLIACLTTGMHNVAKVDAQTLLEFDPGNKDYSYYLAIAEGATPPEQPASIIVSEFDAFAKSFDRIMVRELHYKLPQVVAKLIEQWHPDRKGDILDLGCGTGLLGVCLGRTERVLVGVDLSNEMVDQALKHNIYDKFHIVNMLDALRDTPAQQYHVITALDVLIYIGKLDNAIPDAFRILLPGGRFVFSCEESDNHEVDYVINRRLHYQHRRQYIHGLLSTAGFQDIEFTDQVLHIERGEPVKGFLVVAQRPI